MEFLFLSDFLKLFFVCKDLGTSMGIDLPFLKFICGFAFCENVSFVIQFRLEHVCKKFLIVFFLALLGEIYSRELKGVSAYERSKNFNLLENQVFPRTI